MSTCEATHPIRLTPKRSEFLLLPLHVPHRGLRGDAGTAAREGVAASCLPAAPDGAARKILPVVGPIAERIAVPGRLRRERRELQVLPNGACSLHELARRQSQRRRSALERRVNQQGRFLTA